MPSGGRRRDPMLGRVLNETYTLERRIGSGGMGRVYAGTHLRLSRPVAVKVLLSKFAANPDSVERFRHEARSASALGHPNIVQVFDFNQTDDSLWYIVMELLEGEDLRSLIKKEGKLDPRLCLPIIRQTADALDLAHSKGLIHRDLKPSNIFLRSGGARREVRILDFGVAKVLGAELGLTMDGSLLGTPHYMAPEQAAGGTPLTRRVDIYALGTVLFEMLTGTRPFTADSPLSVLHLRATRDAPPPSSLVPGLPDTIDPVLKRALERDPEKRFESTVELSLAFERALVDAGINVSDEALTEAEDHDLDGMEADTILVSGDGSSTGSESEAPSSIVRLQGTDELRIATIVSVSVGSSDADADEVELDEVLERTGALLEELSATVSARGGVVEHQLGDSLVAVFGVPTATGDDPVRAVRAALAVRDAGKEHAGEGIEVRIGVQTGRVLTRKKRSGVTGEVVKVASRLADECPGGEVLVGHETFVQIRGRFDLSFRESLRVRGQKEPLRTYRVTGERDHGVVLDVRGRDAEEAPLAGRDAEEAYLWGLYRRAVDERLAQVAILVGGPGSGKTRMAHELAATLEERGERVNYFPAQAGELSGQTPFGLFAELVRVKTGSSRAMTAEEAGARLVELIRWPFASSTQPGTSAGPISSEMLEPSEIAAAIGDAIGVPVEGEALPTEGPQAQLERLALAVRTFVSALAMKHPVVLVLDDLHRSDRESLDLLEHILRGLEEEPVFVLGMARPDLLETRPVLLGGFEHLSLIYLRNLSAAATSGLVSSLLGGRAPRGLGQAIHKRSGGNPHVVEEMVNALKESGQLKDTEDERGWVFLGDLESLDVPGRAEALLQARVDQLDPEDRNVLRCAAVVGPVFWEDALKHLGMEKAGARLEGLAQTGHIHPRPVSRFPGTRQWAFKSELMCDVARGNLPARERRQIHLSVAEWLARQPVRDPEALALRAHHLVSGGDRKAAFELLKEAAQNGEKQHRWQAALASYERAFGLAEGDQDRETCLALASHVGRLAVRAHTPGRGIPILDRALALLEDEGDDEAEANLLQLLGRALAIHGDAARAREVTEKAQAVAERLDDLRLRFEAGKALGFVLYYADEFAGAAAAFERCLEMARELEDQPEVALNLYNVADSSLAAGDWEKALRFADKAARVAEREESVSFVRHSASGISAFVRAKHKGEPTALSELEQWAAFADEQGFIDQQLDARQYLIEVYEHSGRLAEALAVAEHGLEIARRAGSVQAERRIGEVMARIKELSPTQV